MNESYEVLISVIIPIFNGQKYLEDCLNNLKKQNLKQDFEIILINDGSTESYDQIIINFNTLNLKIYNLEKNSGQSVARNLGIKESKGKYVFFMDVDDRISENCLDILIKTTKEFDYDYIFTDFQRIENSKNLRKEKFNYLSEKIFSKNDILENMKRELYDTTLGHLGLFGCNGRLIKREILIKNNIFFEEKMRWMEDKIFGWDLLKHVNKAKYLKIQLYSYYVNLNVKSAVIDSLSRSDTMPLIKTICSHVKKNFLFLKVPEKEVEKLLNQALIFFSIQILVSVSRSITLKKINLNEGINLRKKIIKEILNNLEVKNAIKFYKPSSEESMFIPIAIKLNSSFLLELACKLRAKKTIKIRRLGKN